VSKTLCCIKKYDVIISFHSSHFDRRKFYFRSKKEGDIDRGKEKEDTVEEEVGNGMPKEIERAKKKL
jgi:hypothetical protein